MCMPVCMIWCCDAIASSGVCNNAASLIYRLPVCVHVNIYDGLGLLLYLLVLCNYFVYRMRLTLMNKLKFQLQAKFEIKKSLKMTDSLSSKSSGLVHNIRLI